MLLNAADGKDQLLTGLGLDPFPKDVVKHMNSEYQDALEKLSSTKHCKLEAANRACKQSMLSSISKKNLKKHGR